jgi:hypothetical protein
VDEPDFNNQSDFVSEVLPIVDRAGGLARIVIVKATFSLADSGLLKLAEKQRNIRLGDEYWGAPEIADIRLPTDYGLQKIGTDFVLSGCAVAPLGQTVPFVDVGLRVADRRKVLRVHGERYWKRGILGVVPGPSKALASVPLAWARAWGGLDLSDPDRPLEEPHNPIGSGVAHEPAKLIDSLAPQIEAVNHPIAEAGGKNIPHGCSPLGPRFEPRRAAAGTYDKAWLDKIYPARPSDYRPEHENCAAPGLHFLEGLRGGEQVQIVGVHASRFFEFQLPKWLIRVRAKIDDKVLDLHPPLDTVVVDSEALTLELVWRAIFPCPPRMRNRFTAIRVDAKEFLS